MLVIFDWDGTLIDSADKIVAAMQAAMSDADLVVRGSADIRQIIGLGMHEATAELYPDASNEQKSLLQQHYARHFVQRDAVPCEFFPGSMEFVSELRRLGHQTAVATGKSRRGLDRVFAATGRGKLFDTSRCADETRSKPHPQMLFELLDETGTSAADAIMIGDTEYDLAMAVSAGVAAVGVSFGVHSVMRLQAAGAQFIANSYTELAQWFTDHTAAR
ncbi:MAG: HAD-IA family hydrolase [Pseudomonadales bacterium]